MKKILFVALAAATMMSCTENEVIENAGNKKVVTFGTAVSSTTRAAITDDAALQKSGFTVYAYNTGADAAGTGKLNNVFMNGLAVSYKTDKWTFDGTYYWPLEQKIQFFAYATDNAATYNAETTDKYPTIGYTIAKESADQKDFVVAKATNQTQATSENGVKLTFDHVLTQVNFSVKGDDADLTYKISSLKIEGVANTGTYSYDTKTWTPTGTAGTYTYPIAADASVKGTTAVKLDQPDGALMLMPQTLPADAKITIVYQVFNAEDVPVSTVVTAPVALTGTAAWEPGKKIRYTLTLANNAAKVSFAPEVGDWSETDDSNVEK